MLRFMLSVLCALACAEVTFFPQFNAVLHCNFNSKTQGCCIFSRQSWNLGVVLHRSLLLTSLRACVFPFLCSALANSYFTSLLTSFCLLFDFCCHWRVANFLFYLKKKTCCKSLPRALNIYIYETTCSSISAPSDCHCSLFFLFTRSVSFGWS